MQYFVMSEFDCACCQLNGMQSTTLVKLDNARFHADVPFKINSGFRCKQHNHNEGGSYTSSHLGGWATDIKAISYVSRFKIVSGLVKAGFNRIGLAKTFIHADDDPNKLANVIWLY